MTAEEAIKDFLLMLVVCLGFIQGVAFFVRIAR
jgi:hypothetical protein